jgi:hypothetical protein
LSEKNFPFDKVIFVCELKEKAIVIYDKAFPLQEAPLINYEKEAVIPVVQPSILPFNKIVDISFTEEPHVLPQKKSKKERRTARGHGNNNS